jgi:hypothetical protein
MALQTDGTTTSGAWRSGWRFGANSASGSDVARVREVGRGRAEVRDEEDEGDEGVADRTVWRSPIIGTASTVNRVYARLYKVVDCTGRKR